MTEKALAAALSFALLLTAHAADDVKVRGGLPNFCRTLAKRDRTRIVYFGGGITQGLGAAKPGLAYRSGVTRYFRKQFLKASIVEYVHSVPGTGSWLAAFRTNKEVVRHYIPLGLVVVEFAVDDRGEPEERVIASVEGIVRQIRARCPEAEILFLYALCKDDMDAFKKGKLPDCIRRHEKVAEHYSIPSVNMAQSVASKIQSGELTFEEFSEDGIHPTDKGHALYVEAVKPLIDRCKAAAETDGEPVKYKLPKPLSKCPLDKAQLVSCERADLETGWLGWQESPVERFFHVVRCEEPGPTVTLRFQGDTVGYFDAIGPDCGDLEYSLDGGGWKHQANFDQEAKTGHRAHARLVAEGLDPKKTHELKLRVARKKPKGSTGRWARLAFFLVNGRPVYDDPYKGMTPLQRIDAIYATMPPVEYAPHKDRRTLLPKTMKRLRDGGTLRIVMLGDSIVNDTAGSNYEHLLMRLYPKCKVEKIRAVRGSTGCWWYKEEGRVKEYVLDHKPDLLMIGGISQRNDVESIRDVIRQVRAANSDIEILVMTGAFGAKDPREDPEWSDDVDPKGEGYRTQLMRMAAEEKVEFLDMRGPWGHYIRETAKALGPYKRDRVHANDRGKQILGRILEKYFGPK